MLYILAHRTTWFGSDERLETAIIKLLSTIYGERENHEVLERMGSDIVSGDEIKDKTRRVFTNEQHIQDVLKKKHYTRKALHTDAENELWWVLDGWQDTEFTNWLQKLRKRAGDHSKP